MTQPEREKYGDPLTVVDETMPDSSFGHLRRLLSAGSLDPTFLLECCERAALCVNAMTGIDDPAKFMAEVREVLTAAEKSAKHHCATGLANRCRAMLAQLGAKPLSRA